MSLLSACSKDGAADQAYQFVIGVSLANLTEPWRINMSEEIKSEASHYPNLRVVFSDAADSSSRQIQDVKKLLDCGIDLLIISPNDAEALTPIIAEAYKRIPVILLDRSVVGYDYTLYIGPDNRLIGKQAGQYVTDLLGGKGGQSRGDHGHAPARLLSSTGAWVSRRPLRRTRASGSSAPSLRTGCATRRRTS